MDIEIEWYERFGAAGALRSLLLERQGAGTINVIDEGQSWHVCVSPAGAASLRIVDPDRAVQPWRSCDRRWVLCYNGEIFNYRELRGELMRLGHRMRTDCGAVTTSTGPSPKTAPGRTTTCSSTPATSRAPRGGTPPPWSRSWPAPSAAGNPNL
jgi:Glutamine amidotransferase domain